MKAVIFLISLVWANDLTGVTKTDCRRCRVNSKFNKFCPPYEGWSGISDGKGYGNCCDTKAKIGGVSVACAASSKFYCSDWLESDTTTGDYLVPELYEAFCPFEQETCYSGRGADTLDSRGYNQHEGRVIPVKGHGILQAGTTAAFVRGSSCAWHLAGDS